MPLCAWQDIIVTVKEKLSIRSTEYFALALEEQYNISRLHLLHEEELIQQVHCPCPWGGDAGWAGGSPQPEPQTGLTWRRDALSRAWKAQSSLSLGDHGARTA